MTKKYYSITHRHTKNTQVGEISFSKVKWKIIQSAFSKTCRRKGSSLKTNKQKQTKENKTKPKNHEFIQQNLKQTLSNFISKAE